MMQDKWIIRAFSYNLLEDIGEREIFAYRIPNIFDISSNNLGIISK